MIGKKMARPLSSVVVGAVLICASLAGPWASLVHASADTVDELHYSYGNTSDSVVFDWHGQEQNIYYGLDTTYGNQAVATDSAITPVDSAGPFREVALTGLVPNTSYHYKVGVDGLDHTFSTIPTGDFTWSDIGDTAASNCDAWMTQTHALVAAQNPNFVTHGGDISYANECGTAAVHQYYVDQEAWSHSAAFQLALGNHEYGSPNSESIPGAIRDSMSNYKGRSFITNAQTVPNDTADQINNPGCGWETSASTNFCQGEDWGWFRAGNVLFISYPEPWVNAQTDWGNRAALLMANAQADPTVDFIVTYGHRPQYSSTSSSIDTQIRTAITQLAQSFSPTASNPSGKYILNIQHHVHGEEVFSPIYGLVNMTNGGGGSGQASYDATPAANSIFRSAHPGQLVANYSAGAHSLTVRLLCGPQYSTSTKDACTYGSTLYTQTFQSANTPAIPKIATTLTDNVGTPQVGQQLTYTVSVTNQTANTTTQGVTATLTLPTNETIVNANGGTVNGNTISWNFGTLTGGQSATTAQVIVQVASGNVGDYLTANAAVTSTDGACGNTGSVCSASDTDTVTATPTAKQWVGNLGVETNLTGWTGVYGNTAWSLSSRDTSTAHSGAASIKVTALAGATNGSLGFNDNPRWVTSTVAGKAYTQSAWVKPTFVGQKLNLRLREWNGSTLITDKVITITAATINWQQISQTVNAAATGNQLSFVVYASSFNAGQSFYADDFSLTTAN